MDPDIGAGLASALFPVALSVGAVVARVFGMMTILPMFTRLGLSGLLRGAVALALAMPLVPAVMTQLAAGRPLDPLGLLVVLTKELLVGIVLGVVFGAPFWAVEIAGELVDQQRQSEAAILPDPSQQSETGLTGTLFVLTTIVVFFAGGGMRFLFDALVASYAIWPPFDLLPHASPGAAYEVLALLDAVLQAGVVLASPLVIAMVVTELSMALLGRFAPNLSVYDLALSAKSLVYAIGMPIYAGVLIGYFRSGLAPLADLHRQLQRLAF